MKREELARYIDHTNLKMDAGREDIRKLCEEAIKYNFYAVCVNPYRVRDAKEFLKKSDIKVASVVGFPLGANTIDVKVHETIKSIVDGAEEIDLVMNIGAFKDGDYDYVAREIETVAEVCHGMNALLKVIIETSLLNEDEIKKAAKIVVENGGDFVKTNTGFMKRGVSIRDVEIIKKAIGNKAGIKASGGIRDAEFAISLIKAGATRLGASRGVEIIESLKEL